MLQKVKKLNFKINIKNKKQFNLIISSSIYFMNTSYFYINYPNLKLKVIKKLIQKMH